jgi:serine/threonine protein kinase
MQRRASALEQARVPAHWERETVACRWDLPDIQPVAGQIGPYKLHCELASGGMGTVYVATCELGPSLSRTVALKTIRRDMASNPEFVRMFLDEARVHASIEHSYVCRLLDAGMVRDRPYVAMEYLIGEPLSRVFSVLCRRPSRSGVAWAIRAVADLCQGLHAVHEARDHEGMRLQTVHRDISPHNLVVLYDGTVRVMDFGVAKVLGSIQTPAHTVKGKIAYMAPEQGRAERLDRRADLWSMGVVLWELLTARLLFMQDSLQTLVSEGHYERIVPPSHFNPCVPAALDAVVMRALQVDRTRRYRDAQEMGEALDEVLQAHFGTPPKLMLGTHLDAMFAGSRSFRKNIVSHAQRQHTTESGARRIDPALQKALDDLSGATKSERRLEPRPAPTPSLKQGGVRRALAWFARF